MRSVTEADSTVTLPCSALTPLDDRRAAHVHPLGKAWEDVLQIALPAAREDQQSSSIPRDTAESHLFLASRKKSGQTASFCQLWEEGENGHGEACSETARRREKNSYVGNKSLSSSFLHYWTKYWAAELSLETGLDPASSQSGILCKRSRARGKACSHKIPRNKSQLDTSIVLTDFTLSA